MQFAVKKLVEEEEEEEDKYKMGSMQLGTTAAMARLMHIISVVHCDMQCGAKVGGA